PGLVPPTATGSRRWPRGPPALWSSVSSPRPSWLPAAAPASTSRSRRSSATPTGPTPSTRRLPPPTCPPPQPSPSRPARDPHPLPDRAHDHFPSTPTHRPAPQPSRPPTAAWSMPAVIAVTASPAYATSGGGATPAATQLTALEPQA